MMFGGDKGFHSRHFTELVLQFLSIRMDAVPNLFWHRSLPREAIEKVIKISFSPDKKHLSESPTSQSSTRAWLAAC
jgi:hypothetical protein